ncbi:hypothetical protein RRG08_003588 [Elysia crispata]|uniref:Uncharacterized protein n=1 Tax=Elysia crispata TaxID=231223 RepID=A0AAE0YJF7_9GAST|nr:hypothetical protein RRG08_003588 [Elysia crispata]
MSTARRCLRAFACPNRRLNSPGHWRAWHLAGDTPGPALTGSEKSFGYQLETGDVHIVSSNILSKADLFLAYFKAESPINRVRRTRIYLAHIEMTTKSTVRGELGSPSIDKQENRLNTCLLNSWEPDLMVRSMKNFASLFGVALLTQFSDVKEASVTQYRARQRRGPNAISALTVVLKLLPLVSGWVFPLISNNYQPPLLLDS